MALRVVPNKGGEEEENDDDDEERERAQARASTKTSKKIPTQCQGRETDAIFNFLTDTVQGHAAYPGTWGDVLDAGAGMSSFCWLAKHEYRSITEITAATGGTYGSRELESATASLSDVDIVLGNWRDETFMSGRHFDVVVADCELWLRRGYLLEAFTFSLTSTHIRSSSPLPRPLSPSSHFSFFFCVSLFQTSSAPRRDTGLMAPTRCCTV